MRRSKDQSNLVEYIKDYRKSVKFKLFSCRHHYDLAVDLVEHGSLKTQLDRNTVYAEIEAVIYSASSAFDILCQEVNWVLDLGLEEKRVNVRTVAAKLRDYAHGKHSKVNALLGNFAGSELYNNMTELRNQVTHRSVMEDITIKSYPWLEVVPDLASRSAKKVVIVDNRAIYLDKSVNLRYKIETAEHEKEDRPKDMGGPIIIMWRGYPLFEIVQLLLQEVSTTVSKVEEILDK